ncbi:hypothetical protein [Paraburkholderia caledonica]|uniref:hypothetical protein n=1 Tax=Paraburkholderia caledonica TaxID=134536 RepID=UPI0015C5AA98|nr:hypothetical protein [Paraburkholderia caledonica]
MSEPATTDLRTALETAAKAMREGRPEEPVLITAQALWAINTVIYQQDRAIEQLRRKQ